MRLAVFALIALAALSGVTADGASDAMRSRFDAWKAAYGKQYATTEE
jgi:hypothetical protein